jgi:ABC-2 type transport system ATP-binding protein
VLGGSDGPATEVAADDPDALAAALTAAGATFQREGDKIVVLGLTPAQVGPIASRAQVTVLGLAPRARSLETAFLALTADRPPA